MNTAFLRIAQYDARAIIPLDVVCRDYFAPLTMDTFARKLATGAIKLPVVRMEASQKGAKGVHLQDLADYVDARREAGGRELAALTAY